MFGCLLSEMTWGGASLPMLACKAQWCQEQSLRAVYNAKIDRPILSKKQSLREGANYNQGEDHSYADQK